MKKIVAVCAIVIILALYASFSFLGLSGQHQYVVDMQNGPSFDPHYVTITDKKNVFYREKLKLQEGFINGAAEGVVSPDSKYIVILARHQTPQNTCEKTDVLLYDMEQKKYTNLTNIINTDACDRSGAYWDSAALEWSPDSHRVNYSRNGTTCELTHAQPDCVPVSQTVKGYFELHNLEDHVVTAE